VTAAARHVKRAMTEGFDDPRLAADVREGILLGRGWLGREGIPPRLPDGPQVVTAVVFRDGARIDVWTWTEALAEMNDPGTHQILRNAADQIAACPVGAVLLVVGSGGNYWCAPVGHLTGEDGGDA
jgi:hypothetical protein